MRKSLIFLLIPGVLGLSACDRVHNLLFPVGKASEKVACGEVKNFAFDVVRAALDSEGRVPTGEELGALYEEKLPVRDARLTNLLLRFHDKIHEATQGYSYNELQEKLASLEVGIVDGFELGQESKELENLVSEINAEAKSIGIECLPEKTKSAAGGLPTVWQGGRRALATAYQSCEVLGRAPMTATTPELQGIKVVGTHSDGIGSVRIVSDRALASATHPYIKNVQYGESCQAVSANPLIYDYGGKPYYTSDENSALNFFRNAGSGSAALGVDCSGFVFASLGTAGLKVHPERVMKASLVVGIPARAYMEPADNGMPCFSKVAMGKDGTLRPGDLVASTGHIIIIDTVGADPLGLNIARNKDECALINYQNFSFVVMQSSPSGGAVGINRFEAKDYLATNASMRSGLENYARSACVARFDGRNDVVAGNVVRVVRHSLSSSCRTRPIVLTGQACIKNCSYIE